MMYVGDPIELLRILVYLFHILAANPFVVLFLFVAVGIIAGLVADVLHYLAVAALRRRICELEQEVFNDKP